LPETFFIISGIERDNINIHKCAEKVSFFLSDCNKIDFCRYIFENNQISSFVKIGPVGSELSHADGQTDRRSGRQAGRQAGRYVKASNCFSQFCETGLKSEECIL